MNRKLLVVILLFVVVLIVLVVVTVVLSDKESKSDEKAGSPTSLALKSAGIVPDVLPSVPDSLGVISINYSDSVSVSPPGMELTPEESGAEPTSMEWSPCESGTSYTLVMTDPDAPSPEEPTRREYRHWVVMNVAGCGGGDSLRGGDVRTEYKGPAPPEGVHRYVFLAYAQPQPQITDANLRDKNITLNDTPQNRASWKVHLFAKSLDLKLVAANFFRAQTQLKEE